MISLLSKNGLVTHLLGHRYYQVRSDNRGLQPYFWGLAHPPLQIAAGVVVDIVDVVAATLVLLLKETMWWAVLRLSCWTSLYRQETVKHLGFCLDISVDDVRPATWAFWGMFQVPEYMRT